MSRKAVHARVRDLPATRRALAILMLRGVGLVAAMAVLRTFAPGGWQLGLEDLAVGSAFVLVVGGLLLRFSETRVATRVAYPTRATVLLLVATVLFVTACAQEVERHDVWSLGVQLVTLAFVRNVWFRSEAA